MRPVSTAIEQMEALQERIRQAPGPLLAARIKRARKSAEQLHTNPRKRSHDRLAVAVGSSRQHLIKLEKAQHRPGAELLTRIAEATEREVEWFLDPDLDPSPFPDEAA